jgi:PhzF family phenazine biosynthesis protein
MTEVLRYAAFTTDPAGGNPAGVVLDAAGLDEPAMQAVAAEVGYSETAFLRPVSAGRYGVRYFSPLAEVAFCGHATIASAVALAHRDGPGELLFDTPAGEIAVRTEQREVLLASLVSVPTTTRPVAPDELSRALAALRWSAEDLDPDWPAHVANAGNDHLVLAAASRARLADLDYDFTALGDLMRELDWTTVALFWPEDETTVHTRDPFPVGGVVEDPATGAAAAAFGAYLRELGLVTPPARVTIHQGDDMGRPSLLLVDLDEDRASGVRVTGAAVRIAA